MRTRTASLGGLVSAFHGGVNIRKSWLLEGVAAMVVNWLPGAAAMLWITLYAMVECQIPIKAEK
jgi:hypothetical protein